MCDCIGSVGGAGACCSWSDSLLAGATSGPTSPVLTNGASLQSAGQTLGLLSGSGFGISVITGAPAIDADSGNIELNVGTATGLGNGGDIRLDSGQGLGSGGGGDIRLQGGQAFGAGNGGGLLQVAGAGGTNGGSITHTAGDSSHGTGNGGSFSAASGDSGGVLGASATLVGASPTQGGNISLVAGAGPIGGSISLSTQGGGPGGNQISQSANGADAALAGNVNGATAYIFNANSNFAAAASGSALVKSPAGIELIYVPNNQLTFAYGRPLSNTTPLATNQQLFVGNVANQDIIAAPRDGFLKILNVYFCYTASGLGPGVGSTVSLRLRKNTVDWVTVDIVDLAVQNWAIPINESFANGDDIDVVCQVLGVALTGAGIVNTQFSLEFR